MAHWYKSLLTGRVRRRVCSWRLIDDDICSCPEYFENYNWCTSTFSTVLPLFSVNLPPVQFTRRYIVLPGYTLPQSSFRSTVNLKLNLRSVRPVRPMLKKLYTGHYHAIFALGFQETGRLTRLCLNLRRYHAYRRRVCLDWSLRSIHIFCFTIVF